MTHRPTPGDCQFRTRRRRDAKRENSEICGAVSPASGWHSRSRQNRRQRPAASRLTRWVFGRQLNRRQRILTMSCATTRPCRMPRAAACVRFAALRTGRLPSGLKSSTSRRSSSDEVAAIRASRSPAQSDGRAGQAIDRIGNAFGHPVANRPQQDGTAPLRSGPAIELVNLLFDLFLAIGQRHGDILRRRRRRTGAPQPYGTSPIFSSPIRLDGRSLVGLFFTVCGGQRSTRTGRALVAWRWVFERVDVFVNRATPTIS